MVVEIDPGVAVERARFVGTHDRFLLCVSGKKLLLFDSVFGDPVGNHELHAASLMEAGQDGEKLICLAEDGTAVVLQLPDFRVVGKHDVGDPSPFRTISEQNPANEFSLLKRDGSVTTVAVFEEGKLTALDPFSLFDGPVGEFAFLTYDSRHQWLFGHSGHRRSPPKIRHLASGNEAEATFSTDVITDNGGSMTYLSNEQTGESFLGQMSVNDNGFAGQFLAQAINSGSGLRLHISGGTPADPSQWTHAEAVMHSNDRVSLHRFHNNEEATERLNAGTFARASAAYQSIPSLFPERTDLLRAADFSPALRTLCVTSPDRLWLLEPGQILDDGMAAHEGFSLSANHLFTTRGQVYDELALRVERHRMPDRAAPQTFVLTLSVDLEDQKESVYSARSDHRHPERVADSLRVACSLDGTKLWVLAHLKPSEKLESTAFQAGFHLMEYEVGTQFSGYRNLRNPIKATRLQGFPEIDPKEVDDFQFFVGTGSGDRGFLIVTHSTGAVTYNTQNGERIGAVESVKAPVFSPEGSHLAARKPGGPNTLEILTLPDFERQHSLELPNPPLAMAFKANDNFLMIGDGTEITTLEWNSDLQISSRPSKFLPRAFTPDGRRFIALLDDGDRRGPLILLDSETFGERLQIGQVASLWDPVHFSGHSNVVITAHPYVNGFIRSIPLMTEEETLDLLRTPYLPEVNDQVSPVQLLEGAKKDTKIFETRQGRAVAKLFMKKLGKEYHVLVNCSWTSAQRKARALGGEQLIINDFMEGSQLGLILGKFGRNTWYGVHALNPTGTPETVGGEVWPGEKLDTQEAPLRRPFVSVKTGRKFMWEGNSQRTLGKVSVLNSAIIEVPFKEEPDDKPAPEEPADPEE